MQILKPRLVIITGISCTGKTTLRNGLLEEIANSFVLDKDSINQGILHVLPTQSKKLPSFEDYVKQDNVFPNCAREVQTPFGKMIQVDPRNDFYERHGKKNTYMVKAKIASDNLKRGKVPVIDCFPIDYIQNMQLKAFMDQDIFKDYQKYLIHCTFEEEAGYQRHVHMMEIDEEFARRNKGTGKFDTREQFHIFVTQKQPPVPKELAEYEHLLIDTTKYSPGQCVDLALNYISE